MKYIRPSVRWVLLLPIAAFAWGQPVSTQQLELVPYRVPGWSFTPSVSAGVLFDSNVALTDARADTGATEGDAIYLVTPSGQIEYLGRRTDFSAGYQGHLRRYSDFSQLNGFDQRVASSLRHAINRRVTLSIRDSYMDVPTTDETELNGVPFTRTGSRTNRLASSVDARLTKFTSLSGQYELTWVDFDGDDVSLNGGWLNSFKGLLSRQLNERTTVGGDYSVRFADLSEGTRELTFHDIGGSIAYQLARDTTVRASGGFSRLQDYSRDETHSGPFVLAGITHRTGVASLGADYERSFVPSFGFGGSSQNQQVRGFVVVPFLESRTYVQGSVAWRRSQPFEPETLALDTLWLRSTVGYSLVRWLRVEGFYNFSRQDSEVTGGEVNRHRVGAQLVISQPMRIR